MFVRWFSIKNFVFKNICNRINYVVFVDYIVVYKVFLLYYVVYKKYWKGKRIGFYRFFCEERKIFFERLSCLLKVILLISDRVKIKLF